MDTKQERERQERKIKLKPLLTDEFLSTLIEAGKALSCGSDFIESKMIEGFVIGCFEIAEKNAPEDFEPSCQHY